jgi:hypothetical protein
MMTGASGPVTVLDIDDATRIEVGTGFACALRASGAVYCWGRNDSGQLGDGTTMSPRLRPVAVAGVTDAIDLSVEGTRSCLVRADGRVACWGSGAASPTEVSGVAGASAVDAAGRCAVVDGGVVCWSSGSPIRVMGLP